MAERLETNTFFDSHLLTLLRVLLYGGTPRPLSGAEQEIVRHGEEVRALHSSLDQGLLALLEEAKDFVMVQDAVYFLLLAQRKSPEALAFAAEVLEIVYREHRHLERPALKKLLEVAGTMPSGWAIGLYGEDGEARYQEEGDPLSPRPASSLDLDRLRDFSSGSH